MMGVNHLWLKKGEGPMYPAKNDLESIHLHVHPYPHDAPESALRDALEQLPWACALTDEDWAFYFATDRYIKVFELEQYVPVEGKVIKEMMPDVQTEVGDMVERLLQAGKSYHAPEHQVWRRADGRTWEMLYSLYPWRYGDKRGTIIECRSIIVDGAERIPQTRYVQTGVQVDPPVKIGKSTYAETSKQAEHRGGSLGIINESLPDLIASKFAEGALNMLLEQKGGEVEVFVTEIFPVIDGSVRHVELYAKIKDLGEPRLPVKPKTNEGPPDSREATE
jgi:PAS domain S-box-containing protein